MSLRTELATTHVAVTPGLPSFVHIDVTNTSEVIEGVTLVVDGIDPAWVEVVPPIVSLFPETSATLVLRFDVPPTCPAGDYLIVANVVSAVDAERGSVHDFWLTVAPAPGAAMTLRPSVLNAGSEGVLQATVVNTGNVPLDVVVTATDPNRVVEAVVRPSLVAIPPAAEATVDVAMRGPRPWFGSTAFRTLTVTATAPEVELSEVASFNQKPRVPRGVVTFLVLAGIIALWATIFLLAVEALRSGEAPAKAVASNFTDGAAQDIPLASIAATAGGTAVSSVDGSPLARITVEPFRQLPDGGLQPAGSAATGDDGTFSLSTLLPGTYKFRFTAEGFEERWYPDAADAGSAGEVSLGALDERDDLGVALTGRPGAFVGTVSLPDSAAAPTITVTAVPDVEAADASADAPAPPTFSTTTSGDFQLADLPTPATYTITFTGADFTQQQLTEVLGAGEVKVLNTVRLGAADGSVTGLVTDSAGAPLGGVAVTARSGDLELATKTPTTGAVGEFTLDGLETPRTYVLTFELEGYSTQTVAVDVLAGQDLQAAPVRLVGGTGSVGGTVSGPDGQPLGGVSVQVLGNDVTASTTTLTGAGAGGYTVRDLPTPGRYTLTFRSPGLLDETRTVEFADAGSVDGIDVTMRRALAVVDGVVSGAGVPLGNATLSLTDGGTPRSTVTSTAPAGRYTFTDVAPGTYVLTASAPGFQTRAVLVRVSAGVDVTRAIDLPAAAP